MYQLLAYKTNGKLVQLGKQDKNKVVIEKRREQFYKDKANDLRIFYTGRTILQEVPKKQVKPRKRYPKGTNVKICVKEHYITTSNGKRKRIEEKWVRATGRFVKSKKK